MNVEMLGSRTLCLVWKFCFPLSHTSLSHSISHRVYTKNISYPLLRSYLARRQGVTAHDVQMGKKVGVAEGDVSTGVETVM